MLLLLTPIIKIIYVFNFVTHIYYFVSALKSKYEKRLLGLTITWSNPFECTVTKTQI